MRDFSVRFSLDAFKIEFCSLTDRSLGAGIILRAIQEDFLEEVETEALNLDRPFSRESSYSSSHPSPSDLNMDFITARFCSFQCSTCFQQ